MLSTILLFFAISGTSSGGVGPSWVLASQILRKTKLNADRLAAPEGFRVMDFPSWDGFWIMGYASESKGSRGTVLLVHGFANNCMRDGVPDAGRWLVSRGFAVAAIDLRGHGWSDGLPTFGTAESWDIRAALDWLEARKYPRPFLLAGVSLGAMASQRAAVQDSRVAGAFLVMPPSCGWDAIYAFLKTAAVAPDFLTRAGQFINDAYGWDIIQNGDVRNHPSRPAHSPRILVVMGTDDIYDIKKTRQVWEHWYSAEPVRYDVSPRQAPEQSKWFLEAPGMGHSLGFNYYPSVNDNGGGSDSEDPRGFELLGEFLDVVAPKKLQSMQADSWPLRVCLAMDANDRDAVRTPDSDGPANCGLEMSPAIWKIEARPEAEACFSLSLINSLPPRLDSFSFFIGENAPACLEEGNCGVEAFANSTTR